MIEDTTSEKVQKRKSHVTNLKEVCRFQLEGEVYTDAPALSLRELLDVLMTLDPVEGKVDERVSSGLVSLADPASNLCHSSCGQ